MKTLYSFLCLVFFILILSLLLSWYFKVLYQKDDFNSCQYTENTCQNQCGGPKTRRTVLYTYHLYPIGQTPSQFDPTDVVKRFQKIIDSGYTYVLLSFYEYPISERLDMDGAFGIFMSMSESVRHDIFDYARTKGVKIFFSIGGANGSESLQQATSDEITKDILTIMKTNDFDGVDIDVEDYTQFPKIAQVTNQLAEQFKTLFPKTPKEISHAPQSANFQGNQGAPSDYFTVYNEAGKNIDFLNIQFYNQGCTHDTFAKIFEPDDNMCQNIAWISTGHKMGSTDYGSVIPLEKLIVGKPICLWTSPQNCPYGGGNGFVDPTTLGQYFEKARQDMKWDAGLMIWEYNPEQPEQATSYLNGVYPS